MCSEKTVKERIVEWLKDTSKFLYISYLGLTEWPPRLKGKEHLVIKLFCHNNKLTSLPHLPNLTFLDCSRNQLTLLPRLHNLTYLSCDRNKITSLPIFPKLTLLSCDRNQLTLLPGSKKLHNLTKLWCSYNQLTSLPSFPKLTELDCDYNQLTSLPSLSNLICLSCEYNQLFSFELTDWKKIWPLLNQIKIKLRNKGIKKVVKVLKNRLYLPRLNQLHQELIYSPNHQGKFYKTLRIGDWSFEKLTSKLSNLNK